MQGNFKKVLRTKKDIRIEELEKDLRDEKTLNIELMGEIQYLKNEIRIMKGRTTTLEVKLKLAQQGIDPKLERYEKYAMKVDDENFKLHNKVKDLQELVGSYEKQIKELKSISSLNNSKLKPREQQITQKEIDYIKQLSKQGLTYRAIKDKVGWSLHTISRVVNGAYDK